MAPKVGVTNRGIYCSVDCYAASDDEARFAQVGLPGRQRKCGRPFRQKKAR